MKKKKEISKYILVGALILSLILNLVLLLNPRSGEPEKSDLTFINDIIKVETISSSEKSVTFTMENTTNDDYTYGEDYFLEVKEGNDWYILENSEKMVFNAIAYHLNSNEKVEETVNFNYHYKNLGKGVYRIVKSLHNNNDIPITESEEKYIFIEFEIN